MVDNVFEYILPVCSAPNCQTCQQNSVQQTGTGHVLFPCQLRTIRQTLNAAWLDRLKVPRVKDDHLQELVHSITCKSTKCALPWIRIDYCCKSGAILDSPPLSYGLDYSKVQRDTRRAARLVRGGLGFCRCRQHTAECDLFKKSNSSAKPVSCHVTNISSSFK